MLLAFVMSVNVTGDCAWGADGGGLSVGIAELYDLPVRAGVGEGDGCWQKTVVAVSTRKNRVWAGSVTIGLDHTDCEVRI